MMLVIAAKATHGPTLRVERYRSTGQALDFCQRNTPFFVVRSINSVRSHPSTRVQGYRGRREIITDQQHPLVGVTSTKRITISCSRSRSIIPVIDSDPCRFVYNGPICRQVPSVDAKLKPPFPHFGTLHRAIDGLMIAWRSLSVSGVSSHESIVYA